MENTEVNLVRLYTNPPSWSVEVINSDGDGGISLAIFSGYGAESSAKSYAKILELFSETNSQKF